ncbi:MAG TPA: sigma 54-interacting transcriptional regulator [Deltaproteobacteria bacterium]|nr:sigma 54-interacting transcriptional regulator [Deltaproteobacteria bacterium]HOD72144.1 sigma 54-interacting transcriptional regulator [Deltaproteobacteria bacterium]HPA76477.1 sigma 54-interacting transcriptional regulator [Deltaproteobacteria bacterium]
MKKRAAAQRKKDARGAAGERAAFCRIKSLLESPCCAIMDSISDGVFTIDSSKRITTFNKAAEEITGFGEAETIGQYCFDVFRADICERNCALEKTLSCRKPLVNLRAHIITKNGDQKPISISTAVLRDDSGSIIGGVETFRDLSEIEELRRQVNRTFNLEDIIGIDGGMKEILSFLPDIAESESPVLIEGPTGSGKEIIARAIHTLSLRRTNPFIPLNCAALPDTLLESELFGYVKGAFTGATRDKPGRFLTAHGGTLFLDEISNTSMLFQADLLRVLQDGEFTPLGGTRSVKADVRIVVASNVDLSALVKEGRFREDLYYRLNVVRVGLPPLNRRRMDIPLLVDHFVRRLNLVKDRNITGVSQDVIDFFMEYPFPGNVRELENILEFAFIACKGTLIDLKHLPMDITANRQSSTQPLAGRELLEAEKIRTVLQMYPTNRPEAARVLGMSRTTLWRKMRKYGMTCSTNET